MKKPRTSSAKVYFILYMNSQGDTLQTRIPAQNAQQAADSLRRTEKEEILISTIARVVSNWK